MAPPNERDVPAIDDWNRLLDGRVAVVTGGGDGIGGAISRLFARHGALVEIAEIDPERGARTVAAIEAEGGVARAHTVDVTRETEVDRFAAAVLARHPRVEVVVNNVGDFRPLVPFRRSTPESWRTMYDTNLLHVFAITHAFLDGMIEAGRGAIVNVHSVEGMRGYPADPVYAAMKAAVAQFTTSLAVAVGRHGIRVNGIGPDLTQTPQVDYLGAPDESGATDETNDTGETNDTEQTNDTGATNDLWKAWAPVGRVGWPEDQARVALLLASEAFSFVTGHNVPVDGGTLAGGGWFWSPAARRFVNRPPQL